MARPVKLGLQAASVALVAGLLALLIYKLATDRTSAATGPAPNFTLPRLDADGHLQLASLRGQAVVLNFWASWCNPCKQEAPELQAAAQRWAGKDVVVLGIDAQDFSGDAKSFMRKYKVRYPVVRDGSGQVVGKYGVEGFPETFFVDRQGRIVGDHVQGPVSRDVLERNIRRALES
ncbi:MAG TPA: TlpA disulfide reductase family protein [Gaiellaceae bacterium]|nr:TlpA disulfide reductase family protein [Gaiellaceae bacterium]